MKKIILLSSVLVLSLAGYAQNLSETVPTIKENPLLTAPPATNLNLTYTPQDNNDVIVGGSKKVKKEKKQKMGLELVLGHANYSLKDFDCTGGVFGELKFIMTAPLGKQPDPRWVGELGIGLGFYNGSATEKKAYASKDDISYAELFNISMRARLILNKYSTRGKWYLYPGLDICPLVVGMPSVKESSSKYSSSTYKHLDAGAGVNIGFNGGLGFEAKHIGFTVGGFAKIGASYSSETSGSLSTTGLYASFKVLF